MLAGTWQGSPKMLFTALPRETLVPRSLSPTLNSAVVHIISSTLFLYNPFRLFSVLSPSVLFAAPDAICISLSFSFRSFVFFFVLRPSGCSNTAASSSTMIKDILGSGLPP